MKKKAFALFLGFTMAAALLAGCGGGSADTSGEPADTAASGDYGEGYVFKHGFDLDYPPYSYIDDDGNVGGFDVEMAQAVCDYYGWEYEAVPFNWDAKDAELNAGSCDCIWSGFTLNGREDDYLWSKAYSDNTQMIMVKKDSGIETLADLAGELWMGVESLGVSSLSMGTAWLGVFAFAFRMYYAYSGLADMAIGIGMCLGFSLPESFRYPFAASSVTDFLHRWNMSLVIWVKEYVFRGNVPGRLFGAFLAWSLMGLWYGPDGTFLLWGVWLAVFYVLETIFWKRVQKALPFVVNWLLTMLVISVGWVFFALNDMESVKIYLYALFGQGAAGLMDDHFWYLLSEYLPVMSLGIVFALPQLSMLIRCLREGRSGLSMALYRFGEKTVPAILLLLSLLKIVGE